jgi:hypothetical protein
MILEGNVDEALGGCARREPRMRRGPLPVGRRDDAAQESL